MPQINVWKVVQKKAKDLVPYAHNPRKITPTRLKQLKERIIAQGFRVPPSVDLDGTILAGHQRVKVLVEMGLGELEIPVSIPVRELTDDERKEVVATDNLSWGDWDKEMLLEHWNVEQLADWGFDEKLLGQPTRKNKAEGDPDEAPEVVVHALSRRGDVFQIGPHRVMCGSSTEPADMAKLMGGVKADMVFTDPPYNVAYTGKTKDALTIQNDKMGAGDFRAFLLAAYRGMVTNMKSGAAIYVCFPPGRDGIPFQTCADESGIKIQVFIAWVKNSLVLGRFDYHCQHESILYGWLEGAAHSWHGDRKQTTVWEIDRPSRNAEHPTMKPIALIEKALGNSSKEEDIVLDSFGGSGSTMVAAHGLNRVGYLMELDERYVDVIVLRMRKLFPDLPVTVNGKALPAEWDQREAKMQKDEGKNPQSAISKKGGKTNAHPVQPQA